MDLIDRAAAIDAALEAADDWDGGCNKSRDKYITSALIELPSAQPEQRWIPCSETIDIPEKEVLCCDRYGNEKNGYLAYVDEQWLCESYVEMMYDPVAWMEKPEPWRGEEHG